MTIWKYQFQVFDNVELEMPAGAEVLSVQVQMGRPTLWAAVDPSRPKERRHFIIHGTGHAFEKAGRFIGTFQMLDGALVWHLFEEAA